MYDFSGQTAIVTGGTRGIGRAISEAFLHAGAAVVATYSNNDELARAFQDENHAYEEKLTVKRFDVGDFGAVEAFFSEFRQTHETLEILVNNCGIRRDSFLATMPEADWLRVLTVNLTGAFHMCRFGITAMVPAHYGRIINVTSPSERLGFVGQSNYAASKAGLVAMTKSLSKEVAKRKITVNCISPGFIDTQFIADLPDALIREYRQSIPLKRFGTPAEVAFAVLFLATREATYITGTSLDVTGGI